MYSDQRNATKSDQKQFSQHVFYNVDYTGCIKDSLLVAFSSVTLVWMHPKGRRMSPLRYDRTDGN